MATNVNTYADGLNNSQSNQFNCTCAPGSAYSSPSFEDANYYCESRTNNTYSSSAYYFNDPLWGGCGSIISNCCDNPTQSWFYQQLNGIITDDIEPRMCRECFFINKGSVLIDLRSLSIIHCLIFGFQQLFNCQIKSVAVTQNLKSLRGERLWSNSDSHATTPATHEVLPES